MNQTGLDQYNCSPIEVHAEKQSYAFYIRFIYEQFSIELILFAAA